LVVNKSSALTDKELNHQQLFNKKFYNIWNREELKNFDEQRNITRLEFAVMLDKTVDPFGSFEVDDNGLIKN
jgi:hypothetical protein